MSARPQAPVAPPSERAAPRSDAILYIEDDPANARLVTRVLAKAGHPEPTCVPDGAAGLDAARALRPDLILIDGHLPGITSEDCVRHLRDDADTRSIPIMVVSADASWAHMDRLRRAGADDYVIKPFELQNFVDRIKASLESATNSGAGG